MFDLDLQVFNYLYNTCKILGKTFGYGAFEGFIMYLGIIVLAVLKGIEISKRKSKKC